ncbi:MAG: M23 family metallopeptidase, partial [Nocardioides sp.]
MGNHRAERTERSGSSETRQSTPYVGKRMAAQAAPRTAPEPATILVAGSETSAAPSTAAGKRRAVKHAGSRGPLFRGLPSPPLLLGVATLAIAISGVVISDPGPAQFSSTSSSTAVAPMRAASAVGGVSGTSTVNTLRGRDLSRSTSREALQQAAGDELVEAAEAQVEVRNEALGALQVKAEQQAEKLAENRWVMPTSPVVLTARFGEYGLWASYHTGLDFNGNSGDPISAIAGGVVTFVGYDGSYGNKTVITLEDGTEIWYAHQTSHSVSVGQTVAS